MTTQIIMVQDVSVSVTWKSVKTISMRVMPPLGQIVMSCPERISFQQAFAYIESKLSWIKKNQKKFSKMPPFRPLAYTNGEAHYYLGDFYEFQHIISDTMRVIIRDKTLEVHAPANTSIKEFEAILDSFYTQQLQKILPPLLEKHIPIMKAPQVVFNIKNTTKVWGSCQHKKRKLTFNSALTRKPLECIELVVVHELSHLFVPNHSKKFYDVLAKFLPDWEARHYKLNTLPF